MISILNKTLKTSELWPNWRTLKEPDFLSVWCGCWVKQCVCGCVCECVWVWERSGSDLTEMENSPGEFWLPRIRKLPISRDLRISSAVLREVFSWNQLHTNTSRNKAEHQNTDTLQRLKHTQESRSTRTVLYEHFFNFGGDVVSGTEQNINLK